MKTKKKVSKKKVTRRAPKPVAQAVVPPMVVMPKMTKVKIHCDNGGVYRLHPVLGTEVTLSEELIASILLVGDQWAKTQSLLKKIYSI